MKKKIQTLERTIMRYMALGSDVEEVAEFLDVPLNVVKKITKSPLFKTELVEMQREIDEQVIQEAASDPVMQVIKINALKAAKRLVDEIDNDGDGSASTRIKACESVLNKGGYGDKREGEGNRVVINISQGKAASIETDEMPLEMDKDISL